MENQTIKNMGFILKSIERELPNAKSSSKEIKTLIHSYKTMLNEFYKLTHSEFKLLEESGIGKELGSQFAFISRTIDVIEEKVMPNLLASKEYIAVNNFSVTLEKMKDIVRDNKELMNKYNNGNNTYNLNSNIEKLLDFSLKTGTLITLFDESHRAIDKTTALIKKASELDCVLILNPNSEIDNAYDIAHNLGLKVSIATPRYTVLPQYESKLKSNGYLVDEFVNVDTISKLNKRGFKLLGGFQRIVI